MLERSEYLTGTYDTETAPRLAVALTLVPRRATRDRLQHFGELYGACESMKQLFATIERLAPTSATAMIIGESGSGKELVAQTIHQLSERRDRPFVAINCGALPENLIESELFGHERGSFTGAARTHRGCFERADRGTLFLDEITEMPVEMQVRLLRVLESGKFTRVGGDQELSADIRVIAASNRDLRQAVADGKLREDLLYRLCVIPVAVPPLREREVDALLLAEMFLDELNAEHGSEKALTAESRERISGYAWPGNVRELKNSIHRAFVLSDNDVNVDVGLTVPALRPDIPSDAPEAMDSERIVRISVGTSLEDAERALIIATLHSVVGSKSRAAQVLGISLKTLYNRLQAYRGSGARADIGCA